MNPHDEKQFEIFDTKTWIIEILNNVKFSNVVMQIRKPKANDKQDPLDRWEIYDNTNTVHREWLKNSNGSLVEFVNIIVACVQDSFGINIIIRNSPSWTPQDRALANTTQ